MKLCLQCAQENDDDAAVCRNCRHGAFAPAMETLDTTPARPGPAAHGPEFLSTERDGNLTVLKCRSLGEAFLVAEELERADILVNFPDEEAMLAEFHECGCVSLRISASSYQAARDLQSVIECREWEERARQPLSVPMMLVAFACGLLPLPGCFFFLMVNDVYKTKGYSRKTKVLCRNFWAGVGGFFIWITLINR